MKYAVHYTDVDHNRNHIAYVKASDDKQAVIRFNELYPDENMVAFEVVEVEDVPDDLFIEPISEITYEAREKVVWDFYNYCMDNNDGNISEMALIKYLEQFVTKPKTNS